MARLLGNMIIWMRLLRATLSWLKPRAIKLWNWMIGSCEIHLNVSVVFEVWLWFEDCGVRATVTFCQLCGKVLLMFTWSLWGVCIQIHTLRYFLWIFVSHAIPIDMFNTLLFSWSTGKTWFPWQSHPTSVLSHTDLVSLTYHYCFCIYIYICTYVYIYVYVYIYMYVCMIIFCTATSSYSTSVSNIADEHPQK